MYNGIGLATPRGSGTNGYVQRNLALVRHRKEKVDYKSEEEIRRSEAAVARQPNRDILEHERKRRIEIKCVEMQELMSEQGYSEEEIDAKVNAFRRVLMAKECAEEKTDIPTDEFGRPVVRESHQIAEANLEKNERLRRAFGLSDDYVDGSSLDPERKARQNLAKEAAKEKEKEKEKDKVKELERNVVSASPSPERAAKIKKKKRRRSSSAKERSESPEKRKEKRKKSKKHKRGR